MANTVEIYSKEKEENQIEFIQQQQQKKQTYK
jgi:hypothetical protein